MPETVEEIFARRKAALGAPVPAPAGPSAEEVYLRRKANAAAAAAHPPDLAAQDRAMEPPLADRFGIMLATDPGIVTRTLSAGIGLLPGTDPDLAWKGAERMASEGNARAKSHLAQGAKDALLLDFEAKARASEAAGDPESAALFRAHASAGADRFMGIPIPEGRAAARTGVDAGSTALNFAGAGIGQFGKGAQIMAEGLPAIRSAIAAPAATALFNTAAAVPGGHEVLRAVPETLKAGARAVGATPGGKVEGAAGLTGDALLAALVARYGGKLPAVPRAVAGEVGGTQAMGAGQDLVQTLGLDPEGAPGMLTGFAGGFAGAAGAAHLEQASLGRAVEAKNARSAAREQGAALDAAAEQAPATGDAIGKMEAERVAKQEAGAALAEPVQRVAETRQEPPPPAPEAIRAEMDMGAATTRAAEALKNPRPPIQEPIPGAAPQAEGADFRPGDQAMFWDEKGGRHYGTVEAVSPDGILKMRVPGRATAIGVPATRADNAGFRRGPEAAPAQPAPDLTGPAPVVPPRVAEQPSQVQRQAGIAPDPVEAPASPVAARTVPRPGEPPAPPTAPATLPPPSIPAAPRGGPAPAPAETGVAPAPGAAAPTDLPPKADLPPAGKSPAPTASRARGKKAKAPPDTPPPPTTAPAATNIQGEPTVTAGGNPEAPVETPLNPDTRPPRKPPGPFGNSTAGMGGGNVNWSHPAVKTALRATAGGSAGFIGALAMENDDEDPKVRWARRIGMTLLGGTAVAGMPPAYGKMRDAVARKRPPKLTEEQASEIRQNVHELRNAKTDATVNADPLELARRVLKDPEDQFVFNEYLRDAHGSETPFLELINRIDAKDRQLANDLLDTAENWRKFSANLGDEGVAAGRVSPEVRTERPGGHLTRITAARAEAGKGWFSRFRKGMPKFKAEEAAHDAWSVTVTLSPEEVRAELKSLGLEDPSGKRDHYLKGDENGTLIKWEPTEKGLEDASKFHDRMSELEKQASEVKVSASRIIGGGDPSMVVQVGKGRNADVGHLAKPQWDDKSLRLRMPHKFAREIAEGVGIAPPKLTESGQALRAEFASPADRATFLDGVREAAVEGATFNVTPQAKKWFSQRLRGATVRAGPGSSGGATGRIIVDAFGPRSRESLKSDIQDPVVRAYVTAIRGGQRNAQARHLSRIATGSDANGPWAVEVPLDANGKPTLKAGETMQVGGKDYVVQETAPELGDLSGMALSPSWHQVLSAKKATAKKEAAFWSTLVSKTKTGKVSTAAGTIFNNVQNLLFHVNNGTSPWMHPVRSTKIGWDFVKAYSTGDFSLVDQKYGKNVGFRLSDSAVRNPEAAEHIKAIMEGVKSAEEVAGEKAQSFIPREVRATAGRVTADAMQQGVLADVGPPGWKRTAKGLAISAGAGATTFGLQSYLNDDDAETILWQMLKGGGWGLGAGAAARTARATFGGTDPYHRALAYDVMTSEKGKWGDPLSPSAARDRLHRKFQDFESMDPRIRAMAGQDGGVGAAFVNEFAPAYFETLRVMKNNLADDPALAVASLMGIPAVAAIVAYASGTFNSPEDKRAAGENTDPGTFFRRGEDGKLLAIETGRLTGADVANDLADGVSDPLNGDSWRKILTDFGGSMIGTAAADTAQAVLNKDSKDLRYGRDNRDPGAGALESGLKVAVRGLSSPYSPQYGTTTSMLRDSIEKPFKQGKKHQPSEPLISAARAATGIFPKTIDYEEVRQGIIGKYDADLRDANEAFAEVMQLDNTKASPKLQAKYRAKHQAAIKEARDRKESELKRLTPQPVGAK